MKKEKSNYYSELSKIVIKDKVERKGKFDYLSWANAWDMIKKIHPDAQRTIYEHEHTGLNFFTDGKYAYVKVGITVNGIEHIDMLPVIDYRNNSIDVDAMTSMDVNTAIQRSTAKAIAMHGLGLTLWTGEDVEVKTPPPTNGTTRKEMINLKVGDSNWGNVIKYVTVNKKMGLEKLSENLKIKYKLSPAVTKELDKAIKG
jgi:hypothetical protein